MVYGRIYKAEFPNGKMYVGSTVLPLKTRIACHISSALNNNPRGCPAFHAAIRKYGKPAFSIIDYVDSEHELDEKELYNIAKFNSMTPNGYNLQARGRSGPLSKTTKEKMSESRRGRRNPRFGKPRSAEVRAKISETKTGSKLSPEHKAKIIEKCSTPEFRKNMSRVKMKLSFEDIEKIKVLKEQGATQKELSIIFKAGRGSIRGALAYQVG